MILNTKTPVTTTTMMIMITIKITIIKIMLMIVSMVARSRVRVLAAWILESWVRIPFKTWMFVRVFLCCAVLCMHRPWDGLITCPRNPDKCLNWFIISGVTQNWNRSQGLMRNIWWWWWEGDDNIHRHEDDVVDDGDDYYVDDSEVDGNSKMYYDHHIYICI
jgi:hypothetical protein